jgi:hypothetical protein
MRRSSVVITVAIFLAAQASAQAQTIYSPPGASLGAEAQATPDPKVEVVRYGNDIAKVDAAAGGLFLGALMTLPACFSSYDGCRLSLGLLAGSAGTYALGPAIVHLSEGEPLRAGASLGLRIGLPLLGAAAFPDSNGDQSGLGFLVGLSGAIAIDWFVLAKKTRTHKRGPRWTPTAMAAEGGAAVGLAGSF